MKSLELMIREDKGRIIVIENDEMVGLITRNGIARYLQIMGK
jgi:predicted transcriptional regulator